LTDAKKRQVVSIVKDEQPSRLSLDTPTHGREQHFTLELVIEAERGRDRRIVLGECGLVICMDPKDGERGVAASAVCVFESDLGFPLAPSAYATQNGFERHEAYPEPPRPHSAAL
jgi:hypothetical protein